MEKLYSIREVAEQNLLGVKVRTIRQLIYDGKIEVINISPEMKRPNYRFTEKALHDFRTKNSVTQ